jgi:solute carrier family 39 (zinc transporter), member 9
MLVGTSLIVIIPEGIEAITEASTSPPAHSHPVRSIQPLGRIAPPVPESDTVAERDSGLIMAAETPSEEDNTSDIVGYIRRATEVTRDDNEPSDSHDEAEVPTFFIGLSLILGFVLMFLVDRLPRIASENFQQPAAPRQISLSNLGGSSLGSVEEESEGFLGSLTPTPKQTRSLATTTGLVIHAAADGIAMGASATSSDTKLGFVIFIALMVHKAPAAFGLTSVLLKQGLSKRAARGHLIVFSLASPLGAWTTYLLVNLLGGAGDGQWNHWWTGMLLLFSAGTFL